MRHPVPCTRDTFSCRPSAAGCHRSSWSGDDMLAFQQSGRTALWGSCWNRHVPLRRASLAQVRRACPGELQVHPGAQPEGHPREGPRLVGTRPPHASMHTLAEAAQRSVAGSAPTVCGRVHNLCRATVSEAPASSLRHATHGRGTAGADADPPARDQRQLVRPVAPSQPLVRPILLQLMCCAHTEITCCCSRAS